MLESSTSARAFCFSPLVAPEERLDRTRAASSSWARRCSSAIAACCCWRSRSPPPTAMADAIMRWSAWPTPLRVATRTAPSRRPRAAAPPFVKLFTSVMPAWSP